MDNINIFIALIVFNADKFCAFFYHECWCFVMFRVSVSVNVFLWDLKFKIGILWVFW